MNQFFLWQHLSKLNVIHLRFISTLKWTCVFFLFFFHGFLALSFTSFLAICPELLCQIIIACAWGYHGNIWWMVKLTGFLKVAWHKLIILQHTTTSVPGIASWRSQVKQRRSYDQFCKFCKFKKKALQHTV